MKSQKTKHSQFADCHFFVATQTARVIFRDQIGVESMFFLRHRQESHRETLISIWVSFPILRDVREEFFF